jgi:hypothetical protein
MKKGERKFLTIVDMKGLTFDFGDLDSMFKNLAF